MVHLGVVEVKRGKGHTGGHRSTGAVHNCTPPQCANNIHRQCDATALIHSSTFAGWTSETVCLCVIEFCLHVIAVVFVCHVRVCILAQVCLCVLRTVYTVYTAYYAMCWVELGI